MISKAFEMGRECLLAFPWIDVALLLLWVGSTYRSWRGYTEGHIVDDVDERALGASVISSQLSAVITGVSVILAGVGAFVALESSPIQPEEARHLFLSALWCVCGLAVALYTMATLPTRTLKQNFVRSKPVAILCAMALFFSLAAGARFVTAVYSLLFP